MKRPKLKGMDFAGLEAIVKEDAKGRYTMRREPVGDEEGEWWIRANQGHSVAVCSSFLRVSLAGECRLTRLGRQVESLELDQVKTAEEAPVVVHGTYLKLWDVIGSSFPCPGKSTTGG